MYSWTFGGIDGGSKTSHYSHSFSGGCRHWGGLQYYFLRSAESRKQLITLRTQAYIDYLRCVAESSKARSDHQKRTELLTRAADAKARISIYGSAEVLSTLAHFEKHEPVIDSPEAADRFLRLVNAMRQESVGRGEIPSADDPRIVLFGNREWAA